MPIDWVEYLTGSGGPGDLPEWAFITPETVAKCGVCGLAWGDPHAPAGRQEWCKMGRNTVLCEGPRG